MTKQEAVNVLLQVAAQTYRSYKGTAADHDMINEAIEEINKKEEEAPKAAMVEVEEIN